MSAAVEDAPPPTERAEINKMADAFRDKMRETNPENTTRLPAAIAAAPAAPPAPPAAPAKPAAPVKPADKPAAPAPAPTPAPEPPKPDVEPEMPKNAKDWKAFKEVKDKALADFRQADTERNTLKTEAAALKAELESLRKGSAEYERVKTEHQETLKTLAERDEILSKVFVEHDPRFQNHFTNRITAIKSDVESIVGKDLAPKVDAILSMAPSKHRDEQIDAIVADLTPWQQARLGNVYQQIHSTERERQAELDKAGENKKLLLAERERKEKEQTAQIEHNRRAMIEDVNHKIEPELAGLDAATSSHLKSTLHKVVTGDVSRDEFLNVLTNAVRGHKYDKDTSALKEENAKLQAQVSELQGAQPPTNGTGGSPPNRSEQGEPTPERTGRELGDTFRKTLNKRS